MNDYSHESCPDLHISLIPEGCVMQKHIDNEIEKLADCLHKGKILQIKVVEDDSTILELGVRKK